MSRFRDSLSSGTRRTRLSDRAGQGTGQVKLSFRFVSSRHGPLLPLLSPLAAVSALDTLLRSRKRGALSLLHELTTDSAEGASPSALFCKGVCVCAYVRTPRVARCSRSLEIAFAKGDIKYKDEMYREMSVLFSRATMVGMDHVYIFDLNA